MSKLIHNKFKQHRQNYISCLFSFIIIIIYVLNTNSQIALANTGINTQIPYSGSILKNDGSILSDGSYRAKFIIYNVSSGGTAIYEEIRDGSTTYAGTGTSPLLSVNDSKFEILLGSQNTTLSSINDDTLWLELQLDMDSNGSYEEVFSPRRRIGSAMSAINSLRLVAANGGTDTDTLSLDVSGNVIATSLGGVVNSSTPGGFDRVVLANSSGQFSQVNISTLSGSSGWALAGNATTDAWNGTSGTRLGTTSAQPLVLATTNATAQDIRFFTGNSGANERMRILGNGNIGINTTTPQARLDVNGGIRVGNDTSTCTSSNIGTLMYNNGGLQVCNTSGWSYLQCPTGYIRVPGSSLYGVKDFCVMKYEAKAVDINAPTVGLLSPTTGFNTIANNTTATTAANGRAIASIASGYPIANIDQPTAASYCTTAGASLINNREWMTIARNIEAQSSNWFNTVTPTVNQVGSGGLWRGHSDGDPNRALEANADDNLGYTGTNNDPTSVNGWSGWKEKRTYTLSNGEIIWDISGNVWEWTSDTIQGQNKPNNSSESLWQEWTAISNYGSLSYDLTRPSNTGWNSSQNMGQYYAGIVTGTSTFAFLRGGHWYATAAGVFALYLSNTPSNTSSTFGFRCVLR